MKYKKLIILFIFSTLLYGQAFSQVYERNRSESRTFKVYNETSLEIYNKYGNIHLFLWDIDSVKIEIALNVKANKESKADKIFEYIDFDFADSRYYIVVRTQLNTNKGSFWSEVSDLANTLFSGNNKAEINYNVYLPRDIDVILENKFGNIYTTNHDGKVKVKLSNGDLKANNINGIFDLELNFGNASINYIEFGKLDVTYSEFELENSNELEIKSKSSTFYIDKVNSLNINSRRDKFYFDDIEYLDGETSFSYLTVRKISENINMTSEYGEIKLEGVDNKFKLIDLTSNYTDIMLLLPPDISCNLKIDHNESTSIIYPENFNGISVETIDKKSDHYRTSGNIGNKSELSGEIIIKIKSGKVSIKEL